MFSFRHISLFTTFCLGLAACTTSPTSSSENGAPVESRSGAAGSGYAPPERLDVAIAERPAPVRRLLRSADVQSRSGRYTVAASTLERALRISPKDSLIWQRLATVRLEQGRWQLAIQMAAKSNSLASGDDAKLRSIRRDNWELISRAEQSLGNTIGAEKARQKARELTESL